MTINTQAKSESAEETKRHGPRSPTKPLPKLWIVFPWLMAGLLGIVLALGHFSSATEAVIGLP